jgi:hypothetical protein
VFAAPTLLELKSQIATANSPACRGDAAAWCWANANPPPKNLLIAIYIPTGCTQGQLASVTTKSGGFLLLQVSLRQVSCPPGAGTQPAPSFTLVAIPLDQLPTGPLTVKVHYLDDSTTGGAQSLDAQTTFKYVGT